MTETFAAPDIAVDRRDDGTIILKSRTGLTGWEPSIIAVLRKRAAEHPDRPLAVHGDHELTYGDAVRRADALAGAFSALGLGPDRPVMILSGNSLEHLLVSLAAYAAGAPAMPISVAYSLMSSDHARIRAIAELTEPGLVFADDAGPFAGALDALADRVPATLVARGERAGALRLEEVVGSDTHRDSPLDGDPGGEAVAKLLFTSGSTGAPKGVINTHRMLCSNQAMLQAIWPFLADEPPVLVDWLPWSHTFGGNHNLNLALFNGGTIYIDDGRPTRVGGDPFSKTLAALNAVPPTLYFNVPAGYALLAPALENDAALAERFFSRLRFMFYAAAALPDALAARLRGLASRYADHEVPLTSSWGTTETSPAATSAHFPNSPTGCIGVPIPGVRVKLAPVGDKLEIRVGGPNVTAGYFRRPDLTEELFDAEGFYCSGDAATLIDPDQGLMFDGRIAENFKLLTGTWVAVGALRTRLLSIAGVLSDAVIAGQDAEYVAALAWVNQAEASRDEATLREHLASALARLNADAGSAGRIERLLLLSEPPSLDAGEITDKGYLNQRACLERRAADVDRLYADPPGPEVITPA
jgi:feruloyl-CoA synthase